jgi:hypothetical protein
VYKKQTWGGKGSKGEYGRFITQDGLKSLKYKRVVFVFDPLGERQADIAQGLVKQFYEEK